MKKLLPSLILIALTQLSLACTVFSINAQDNHFLARNFDWSTQKGFIITHPRGSKNAVHSPTIKGKPLNWISKYGSITFTLMNNKDEPILGVSTSGINEAGLAAAVLQLDSTQFPKAPNKPTVADSLWVQYFLDNAKDVNQAIELAKKIIIQPIIFDGQIVRLHLYLQDATGHAAIFEYLDGKLVVTQGKELRIPLVTNNIYAKSLQKLKLYKSLGGNLPIPGDYDSLSRFVRTAYYMKNLPEITSTQQADAFAFRGLGIAAQSAGSSWPTAWSIVYNLKNRSFKYRTMTNSNIKTVKLNDFDLRKGASVKAIRINNAYQNNIDLHFGKIVK